MSGAGKLIAPDRWGVSTNRFAFCLSHLIPKPVAPMGDSEEMGVVVPVYVGAAAGEVGKGGEVAVAGGVEVVVVVGMPVAVGGNRYCEKNARLEKLS